ncbi:UNVERIFIED_CONTAM: hypothetical protein FKN15_023634, partial [Acipenser sinensis]
PSGHFGTVRLVREKGSGTEYAGKFLKIRKCKSSRLGLDREDVEREVEILQALQHPNIMALRDVFESKAELVLILEMLGDHVTTRLASTVCTACVRAQASGSRRVEPENIMLLEKDMPQPHIKLIDFGLSHRIEEGVEYKSLSGTPQYIGEWNSPDPSWLCQDFWVSQNDIKYGLSGTSPFQGDTDEETLANIVSLTYEFDEQHFSQTSAMAKDFIQSLLVKEPR